MPNDVGYLEVVIVLSAVSVTDSLVLLQQSVTSKASISLFGFTLIEIQARVDIFDYIPFIYKEVEEFNPSFPEKLLTGQTVLAPNNIITLTHDYELESVTQFDYSQAGTLGFGIIDRPVYLMSRLISYKRIPLEVYTNPYPLQNEHRDYPSTVYSFGHSMALSGDFDVFWRWTYDYDQHMYCRIPYWAKFLHEFSGSPQEFDVSDWNYPSIDDFGFLGGPEQEPKYSGTNPFFHPVFGGSVEGYSWYTSGGEGYRIRLKNGVPFQRDYLIKEPRRAPNTGDTYPHVTFPLAQWTHFRKAIKNALQTRTYGQFSNSPFTGTFWLNGREIRFENEPFAFDGYE